jgi:hypothetical protein
MEILSLGTSKENNLNAWQSYFFAPNGVLLDPKGPLK